MYVSSLLYAGIIKKTHAIEVAGTAIWNIIKDTIKDIENSLVIAHHA